MDESLVTKAAGATVGAGRARLALHCAVSCRKASGKAADAQTQQRKTGHLDVAEKSSGGQAGTGQGRAPGVAGILAHPRLSAGPSSPTEVLPECQKGRN